MITKEDAFRNLQKFQTCPGRSTFICVRCEMVLSVVPLCSCDMILLQCSECGVNQASISIHDIKIMNLITPADPIELDCKNLTAGFCRALGKTKIRCVYIDKGECKNGN